MSLKKSLTKEITLLENKKYKIKILIINDEISEDWHSKVIFEQEIDLTKSNMDLMFEDLNDFVEDWSNLNSTAATLTKTYNIITKSDFESKIIKCFTEFLLVYLGELKLPGTSFLLDKNFEIRKYPVCVEYSCRAWIPRIQIRILHGLSKKAYNFYTNIVNGIKIFNINLNENLLKLFYINEFDDIISNKKKYIEKGFNFLNEVLIATDILKTEEQWRLGSNKKVFDLMNFLELMSENRKEIIINSEEIEIFYSIFQRIVYYLMEYLFSRIQQWINSELKNYIKDFSNATNYDALLNEVLYLQRIISDYEEKIKFNDNSLDIFIKNINSSRFKDVQLSKKVNIKKFRELKRLFLALENSTLQLPNLDALFNSYNSFFGKIEEKCKDHGVTEDSLKPLLDLLKEIEEYSRNSEQFNTFLDRFFKELAFFNINKGNIQGQADFNSLTTNTPLTISLVSDYKTYLRSGIVINEQNKTFHNIGWNKKITDTNEEITKIINDLDFLTEMENSLGNYIIFKTFEYYFKLNTTEDPNNVIRFFKLTRVFLITSQIFTDLDQKYKSEFIELLGKSTEKINEFKRELQFLNIDCSELS